MVKKCKFWTENEVMFLKENYKNLSYKELAKKIGRTKGSIMIKANRLNLRKTKSWTKKEKEFLKKYYPNKPKEFLLNKLEDRTWVSIKIKSARKLKLEREDFYYRNQRKKITIPKKSEKFAWWLGVLAGDGCVTKNQVALGVTDKEFAEKWKKIGKEIFNIKSYEYIKYHKNINHKNTHTIKFLSENLVNYLGNWKEKVWDKQLYNKFSWILKNKKYIKSFIEGYFDSEGNISKKKNNNYYISIGIKPNNIKKIIKNMLDRLDIDCKIYKKSIDIFGFNKIKSFSNQIHSSIYRKERLLDICRRLKKIPLKYSMKDYNKVLLLRKKGMNFFQINKKTDFERTTITNWIKFGRKPMEMIVEGSHEI